MDAVNSWEIVSGKKRKNVKEQMTKAKKKAFIENMPRIEANAPVEETHTIYEAFLQEELKKEKKLEQIKPAANIVPSTKKVTGLKKTVEKKKDNKPLTLEEAVSMIQVADLEVLLIRDREMFPDNPDVWLKDLASVINLCLDRSLESDPVFVDKPTDYPMRLLTAPVRDLLAKTIKLSSKQTLEIFLEHCIDSMISDISKGIPTFGYRIFIQLVLRSCPLLVISALPKYAELVKSNVNRPPRALSIMWATGQSGIDIFPNGLKVWTEVMFPVLNQKNLSNFAVKYLENLLSKHQDVKLGLGELTRKDFLSLFDELYAHPSKLAGDLRIRLMVLYPKLKTISFGGQPDANLHHFFSSFLSRCTTDSHAERRAELLTCLVTCLSTDIQSFSTWRQMYIKHLQQSSILLKHISDNLEKMVLSRKVLKETVHAFHLTNEDLALQTSTPPNADYQSCNASCKELLTKLNKTKFPYKWIFLFLVIVTATVVVCDIQQHGSFKKSITHRTLHDSGALLLLTQAWSRTCFYSSKVAVWAVDVWVKTVDIMSPYLQLGWQKLVELSAYIVAATEPLRKWIFRTAPLVLQWFDAKLPWLLEGLRYYSSEVGSSVVDGISWLAQHVIYYTNIVTEWLLTNVLTGSLSPENILSTLSAILVFVQSNIVHAYEWCIQTILSVFK